MAATPLLKAMKTGLKRPIDFSVYKRTFLDPGENFFGLLPIGFFNVPDEEYWDEAGDPPLIETNFGAFISEIEKMFEAGKASEAIGKVNEGAKRRKIWRNMERLFSLGCVLEANGKIEEAHGFFARALSHHAPLHECSEAKSAYDRLLPFVDERDNQQLAAAFALHNRLCNALDQLNWRHALKESYFRIVQQSVAMEGNGLTLKEARALLSAPSPQKNISSSSTVQREEKEEEKEECEEAETKRREEEDKAELLQGAAAFRYMVQMVERGTQLSFKTLMKIHALTVGDDKKYAGKVRDFPEVEEGEGGIDNAVVEDSIKRFLEWLNSHLDETGPMWVDGISLAAVAHLFLVILHPFEDGNGRTGRALSNYVLLRCGFPPTIIPATAPEEKRAYYSAIDLAVYGDVRPFLRFITKCLAETMDQTFSDGSTDSSSIVGDSAETSRRTSSTISVKRGAVEENNLFGYTTASDLGHESLLVLCDDTGIKSSSSMSGSVFAERFGSVLSDVSS